MAKTSAKSKGYRKQKKSKPFLTKGEAIGAAIILVVFIIAFIFFTNDDLLFRIFPDGNLAASDVKEGDVVAYVRNDMKTRFVKIGEANEMDGYTRTTSMNNRNVPISYTYEPEDENATVKYVTISGSAVEAKQLLDSYLATMTGMGVEAVFTDTIETTIDGHNAYVFSYTNNFYSADQDENAVEGEDTTDKPSNVYQQNCNAYIDIDGVHTFCLHISNVGKDESFYLPEDQVLDYTLSFTDCFTLVPVQG